MKSLQFIIAIIFLFTGQLFYGQCPPPSYDIIVTGTSVSNYTLNTGDTLYLSPTADYSGTVTISGGVFFNCGSSVQTFSVTTTTSGGELNNHGDWNSPPAIEIYENTTFSNTAVVTSGGKPLIDNNAIFYNWGTLTSSGSDFRLEPAGQIFNYNNAYISGKKLQIFGYIYNSGTIDALSHFDIEISATIDIDGGCSNVTSDLTVMGILNGISCGTININGNSQVDAGGSISGVIASVDATATAYPFVDVNNGTVGGSVTGTSCGCPGAGVPEICGNGIDDNLDGRVDEALPAGIADNLILWLKADEGFSAGTWTDQGPFGNDATVYGDPTLVTNSLNGNPGISFDTNDHCESPLSELVFENGTNHLSIFAVYSPNSASTARGVFGNEEPLAGNNIAIRDNQIMTGWWTNPAVNEPSYYGLDSHLICVQIDEEDNVSGSPNSSSAYKDGTLLQNFFFDEQAAADVDNMLHIGRTGTHANSKYFDGIIYELIVYYENDGGLSITDTERQKIESYLAVKYGLTISHDYSDSQ